MKTLNEFFPDQEINKSSSTARFGYYEVLHEKNRSTHFLIIGGSHYDKGYFYGKHLAPAIHKIIKNVLRFSKKFGLGTTHEKFTKEKYLQNIHAIYSKAGSHRLSELQGVADGCRDAGLPLENEADMAINMAFFELNEAACCSCCSVNDPLSKKDTFQINTSEFPFPIGCQDNPTIILFFPQNEQGERVGLSHLSLSFTGLLAGVAGVNEKGVSFGSIRSSNIRDPYSSDGTPFLYLMDDALEKAMSVKEMREFVGGRARTNGYFVTVSDPLQTDDSLNLWFLGHQVFKAYRSGERIDHEFLQNPRYSQYTPLEHAVYWMDMPVPGIEAGPEKPYEIIQKFSGKIDDQVALLMSKEMGSRYSVASSLFNTTQMRGWVAFAQHRVPSYLDRYHYLDLKRFFASYEELLIEKPAFRLFEAQAAV